KLGKPRAQTSQRKAGLAAGRAVEEITPWRDRRRPIHGRRHDRCGLRADGPALRRRRNRPRLLRRRLHARPRGAGPGRAIRPARGRAAVAPLPGVSMPDPVELRTVDLDAIRCDPLLQPRAGGADLEAAHLADLRALLSCARRWPPALEPLDVFLLSDRPPPGAYWLAGGHYRLAALAAEKWLTARCRVRRGAWRDAFLFS